MSEDEKQQEANNRGSDNYFYEDERVGLNDILIDPQLLSDDNDEPEDPLGACPPDFRLAKIHQDASRVKLMSQRKMSRRDLENNEMY